MGVKIPKMCPKRPSVAYLTENVLKKSLCAKLLMFKMMKNRGKNILKKV